LYVLYGTAAINLGIKNAEVSVVNGDYVFSNTMTNCTTINGVVLNYRKPEGGGDEGTREEESESKPITLERVKAAFDLVHKKFCKIPHVIIVPSLDPFETEEAKKSIEFLSEIKSEDGSLYFEAEKFRVMYLNDIPKLLSTDFLKPGAPPLKLFQPKNHSEFAEFEHVCAIGFEIDYSSAHLAELHLKMENDDKYVRLVGRAVVAKKDVTEKERMRNKERGSSDGSGDGVGGGVGGDGGGGDNNDDDIGIELPVACGSVTMRSGGIAAIDEMCVIPSARRKGYASEVMKELVRIAVSKFRCHSIVLDATADGERTWRGMGFLPLPALVWMFEHEEEH